MPDIGDLLIALREVLTNGEWTEGEQCGDWKISKEVYAMVADVYDAFSEMPSVLDIAAESGADDIWTQNGW